MTDFSVDPDTVLADNLAQGYVGLRIQQGVPILDRDLNLLSDLVAATVRSVVARYVGSGVGLRPGSATPQRSDSFLVAQVGNDGADNDFVVKAGAAPPGRCLVNGIEVTIDADLRYTAQGPPPPPALAPPATGSRPDVVFLDAFLDTEETGTVMENSQDVAVQTSVRLKPAWRVRVAPGATEPPPADPGHGHLPLARIVRQAGQAKITAAAITDLRAHCFGLPDVRRLLLEPVVLQIPPQARVNDEITIGGRNFQFFTDDAAVTVSFGTITATVTPAKRTPTSLAVKVPAEVQPADNVPLTVHTAYGSSPPGAKIKIQPAA
jgi:hypothetical protein